MHSSHTLVAKSTGLLATDETERQVRHLGSSERSIRRPTPQSPFEHKSILIAIAIPPATIDAHLVRANSSLMAHMNSLVHMRSFRDLR